MNAPNDPLVYGILPSGEFHLFAGPSGSGKTTYLFQFREEYAAGRPIFNHVTRPVPHLYISIDRSEQNVKATLARLNLPANFPILSGINRTDLESIDSIFMLLEKSHPDIRLVFIEGIATLVPNGKVSDYKVVADFCKKIARYCLKRGITIIGSVHATKTKENDRFLNPRERILGSVAWAAFTETVFLFDPVDPDADTADRIKLWILPRNAPKEVHEMKFAGGRLVAAPPASLSSAESLDRLLNFLSLLDLNTEFTADEAVAAAKSSRSHTYRLLKDLQSAGTIRRHVKPGHYIYQQAPFAIDLYSNSQPN